MVSQQEEMAYYWRNPSNQRYYTAILTKDLFNEWVIIKPWAGSKAGRVQHCFYKSYEAI